MVKLLFPSPKEMTATHMGNLRYFWGVPMLFFGTEHFWWRVAVMVLLCWATHAWQVNDAWEKAHNEESNVQDTHCFDISALPDKNIAIILASSIIIIVACAVLIL